MNDIPAVAFVGKQNSGKTTLLEQLIAHLTAKGINVGTVKHHSHAGFDFDVEGKDSWRHGQAGSLYTVIAAPDKIASVCKLDTEPTLEQIIATMQINAQTMNRAIDLILVEGFRRGNIDTIDLFRAGNVQDEEREFVREPKIVAVVTNIDRVSKTAAKEQLAVFDFDEVEKLGNFLCERYLNEVRL